MTKSFIGISRLWYAEPIKALAGEKSTLTADEVKALIGDESTREIKNIHQDTWGYEESDPTVTEYINQLTGKPYYRDVEQQGIPTVNFTLGEYDFADKAALQGGVATEESWERSDSAQIIEKCIIAQAKTGDIIVMPRASIVGKGSFVEKNIGLGVSAVPVETGVKGLASEKWFRGIDLTVA